ncbi:MAG: serine/threonine protein phosphatase, partial [Clostridia bacterium]|nr:serine/threonine protein phosphatase [Clostridia bacterium]
NIINKNINDLFVFLGDYVDNGENSVEVFMGLAELKIKYPENIILLAGNHERDYGKISGSFIFKFYNSYSEPVRREAPKLAPINKDNCFTAVFKSFFGPCAKKLFKSIEPETKVKVDEVTEESNSARGDLIEKYEDVFNSLPLGVVLNLSNSNKVFCTHGGVPVDSSNNPIVLNSETELDEKIIQQLLWNDPTQTTLTTRPTNRADKSWLPHAKRYSSKVAKDFLNTNNFSRMFRAHEFVEDGFRKNDFENAKHHTVFSSANYRTSNQIASIVRINSKHKNFNVIKFGGEKYKFSMGGNVPDYKEISTIENIEI